MSSERPAATDPRCDTSGKDTWIAGRYLVQEELGRGGMGAVYRVQDSSTQRILALKQLIGMRRGASSQTLALFQREYQTLVQLAHPFIIEVYEYGVDRGKPYYTMELLDGSDLRAMAPLQWQRACALLRDVASSLAIVHSRYMVHRDVSSRNVRCTGEGRAKLLDFGAMVPMGPSKRVVGTPPLVAPEALNQQPLDGGTDLFSLGGLAYWLLTGRHAYPARNMEELRDLWRSRPIDPSAIIPDIPAALDELVTSLLSLDRLARPVSAAEVIDRLNAIAGLPEDEPLGVSHSYLTTPNLVGREKPLTDCRKSVLRGLRGFGATVVIEGDSGLGRSRLLMACILDAKIAGGTVLSAASEDCARGEYGVIRALVDDLLEALPNTTLKVAREYADSLGHALPELHDRLGRPALAPVSDPKALRRQVQSAITEFFASMALEDPLLVAVDDIERCDEPSVAVLAALSHFGRAARGLSLVLAVTTQRHIQASAASRALKMLADVGTRITLRGLTRRETESLLATVFGNAPNVTALADWVYALSQGSPRTCMELAQHLVDRGIARYEGGQWVLPSSLQSLALPQNLEQAWDARIRALSEPAKALAEALSLAAWGTTHQLKDCIALSQESDPANVFAALNELLTAQVLTGAGDAYRFRQAGLAQALQRGLGEERLRAIHSRLAAVCEGAGSDRAWAWVHHLQQAGQAERALDLLLAHAREAGPSVGAYPLQVRCCEEGLALAAALQRPPREVQIIRRTLLHLASRHDPALLRHADQALNQLQEESGRAFWEQLGDELEPERRVQQCLHMAQARWEAMSESERGLSPLEAVQELADHAVFVASAAARAMDTRRVARLPGLVAPLRTLAPSLDLLVRILEGSSDGGRGRPLRAGFLAVEKALEQPVPAMTDTVRERTRHIVCYFLALEELYDRSAEPALQRAQQLEAHPSFAATAWKIRMLARLGQGDLVQAERCRQRFEMLAIQNPESDGHLVVGLPHEADLLTMYGDLMGLKRMLRHLAPLAQQFSGWRPHLLWVSGEYHRLRGKLNRALADLQQAASMAAPGGQNAWRHIQPRLIQTLIDRGEIGRARDMAEQALEESRRHELLPVGIRNLEAVLAIAEAKLGLQAQAAGRVDRLIEHGQAHGVGPLGLGNLYETRARVVMEAADRDAFAAWAKLTAGQYRPMRSTALTARYERLMAEAARRGLSLDSQVREAIVDHDDTLSTEGATGTLVPE